MPRRTFKKVAHTIHLYLGLVIGLLFFVIALSGAIYTWEPELSDIQYKQAVVPREIPYIFVSTIKDQLAREFPEGDFRAVTFQGRDRAAKVLLFVPGTYYYAFMDPYTGELLHLQNMREGWLNHLKSLHRNLLLGKVGRKIVHWTTLLALIMVVTGLILWWPQRKTHRKYHFTIQWRAKPIKLNYDLHNVLGFYASWIGVFILLTGIFWGFELFQNGLKVITNEGSNYEQPTSDVGKNPQGFDPDRKVDSLAFAFQGQFPGKMVRINYPHADTDAIQLDVIHPQRLVYSTDHYHFDQYSGALLKGNFQYGIHTEASTFTTLNALVYDIHLGNLGHLPGRILVCLTSLVLASLPITGFIIWWSRRSNTPSK